jgi:DNA invertase Pin-like site-specific DNA recombinase
MKIGYIRVSTVEQNEKRQTEALDSYGVEKVYMEKKSGKDLDREVLAEAMDYCREGDTLVVSDLSRLARNTQDLLNIVEKLTEKKVALITLKESINFSDATGRLILTVLSGIYEFERSIMLERQREGIAIAKKAGKYKGRASIEKPVNFDKVAEQVQKGEMTAVTGMRHLGLKRSIFYRFYKAYKDSIEIVLE